MFETADDFLSVTRDAGGRQQACEDKVKLCFHVIGFLKVSDSVSFCFMLTLILWPFSAFCNFFNLNISALIAI